MKPKKRLPVFARIYNPSKKKLKQQDLKTVGFRHKVTNRTKPKQHQTNNSIQTPLNSTKTLKANRHKGEKLTNLDSKNTRLFYININEMDAGKGITSYYNYANICER